jgi:hypothetical protein
MEISFFIGRRGGNWVLEKTSRNSDRFLLGSFESQLDAERLLAEKLGSGWRSGRLPEIRHELPEAGLVLEEGPTGWVLTGQGRTAEFPASAVGRRAAIEFSHIADLSLGEIALLYETP